MKKIRLDLEVYNLEYIPCHITICTKDGLQTFINDIFTRHCMGIWENYCKKYGFRLFVYCFMPEHIHFVASVNGTTSIISLVQAFKSKVTIDSRKNGLSGQVFQPRFYDRFLRTPEALETEINYIMCNPIRRGLSYEIGEYQYAKCFA